MQIPAPENTQPSHETDIHALAGFEPTNLAGVWAQTHHALEREATRIGTSESVLLHIVLTRCVRKVPTPC
jgi:hypothetical protein